MLLRWIPWVFITPGTYHFYVFFVSYVSYDSLFSFVRYVNVSLLEVLSVFSLWQLWQFCYFNSFYSFNSFIFFVWQFRTEKFFQSGYIIEQVKLNRAFYKIWQAKQSFLEGMASQAKLFCPKVRAKTKLSQAELWLGPNTNT